GPGTPLSPRLHHPNTQRLGRGHRTRHQNPASRLPRRRHHRRRRTGPPPGRHRTVDDRADGPTTRPTPTAHRTTPGLPHRGRNRMTQTEPTTYERSTVSYETARRLLEAAVGAARDAGMPATIVVSDVAGEPIAIARTDGAGLLP